MAVITITEYNALHRDVNGIDMPIGREIIASQSRATAGNFTALNVQTKFIRVATDTAFHFKLATGAAASDPLMPAGSVDYFAVRGSEVCSIAALS